MPKINWNITDQELKQEMVSSDNRWHISKSQKGDAECKFFLTNYDLLLTPYGSGPDYKVCFETFIKDCDLVTSYSGEFGEILCGFRAYSDRRSLQLSFFHFLII